MTMLILRMDNLAWHCADSFAFPDAELVQTGAAACADEIICERTPAIFIARFFEAVVQRRGVWLADPDWGEGRMEELEALCRANQRPGMIMIPTGGTSGRLRFAVHSLKSLLAAADGFLDFFRQEGAHRTLCSLPLHHVSGLMQVLRVARRGGSLYFARPQAPLADLAEDFSPEGCFMSLVPTQLRRLIDSGAVDTLRRFACILLGGAGADRNLLEEARLERLPLCPCYGMTETAAMVCALRPDEFLCVGAEGGVGRSLPHARVCIDETSGVTARGGNSGRIVVRASSLCVELLPGGSVDARCGLETNDIGRIDSQGRLHVRGRADRVIVSGGLKLDAAEVEGVILSSGLVKDAAVLGLPDPEWGQALVAFCVPIDAKEGLDFALGCRLRESLSPAHVPKKWRFLDELPRSSAGKLDGESLLKQTYTR